jgi:uncharacterized protein YjbI with pentapeptide repeats
MEGKPTGAIEITGESGSGKTTALRYLAAKAPPGQHIAWVDNANFLDIVGEMKDGWVVYTTESARTGVACPSFALAGWGDDERIEYLLAVHPDRCQSVILRLSNAHDRSTIGDSPTLWRIVLDEMAEHESICSVDDALWRRVMRVFHEGEDRRLAEVYCLTRFAPHESCAEEAYQGLFRHHSADDMRLLRVPHIRLLLAAEHLARWLGTPKGAFPLLEPDRKYWSLAPVLAQALVGKTAELVANSPQALTRLREILAEDEPCLQPMAASILHACGTGWSPERESKICLDAAWLQRAVWPGVDLSDTRMNGADLSESTLVRARLDRVQAVGARFQDASLTEASLAGIVACNANFVAVDLTRANLEGANFERAFLYHAQCRETNFVGANLRSADLRRCCFAKANLYQATLSDATIDDVDFSSANLGGAMLHGLDLRGALFDEACLVGADLGQCNLEGMRLTSVDFTAANLLLALLSGSVMQGGTMRRATLKEAGLADIQWEEADLRGADLRGAVFHLGSSRSGLVDSPLASEGTRTGFYTDAFDEQAFQSPEQIRKANLRGADLRGANIEGVDFYLVDLRDAKYDWDQLAYFRRCRAILVDPE